MSNDRDTIFSAIRNALADLPERAAYPDYDLDVTVSQAFEPESDLWQLFAKRVTTVNGRYVDGVEAMIAYLREQKVTRGYCDPALTEIHARLSAEWELVPELTRGNVESLEFGITRGTAAVAESGTIILTDRDTSDRLAALAPWISVVTVETQNIFPTIAAAIGQIDDPNVIWVTGPSKTADVEGILIEGVHGPGIQLCCRVPQGAG